MRGNQIIERLYANAHAAHLPVRAHRRLHPARAGTTTPAAPATTTPSSRRWASAASPTACRPCKEVVFDRRSWPCPGSSRCWTPTSRGMEALRQRLLNKTHKYGNDDDYADDLMVRTFDACCSRPSTAGPTPRAAPTGWRCCPPPATSTSARCAWPPRTAGARACPCPRASARCRAPTATGPTAVLKSAAKMDHVKTGGTLLNMKFSPSLLEGEAGIDNLHSLVRSYFKLDGHHMQFNVVGAAKLRGGPGQARAAPRPDRPGGGLQRLLLRPVPGAAGGDHPAHGARHLLTHPGAPPLTPRPGAALPPDARRPFSLSTRDPREHELLGFPVWSGNVRLRSPPVALASGHRFPSLPG